MHPGEHVVPQARASERRLVVAAVGDARVGCTRLAYELLDDLARERRGIVHDRAQGRAREAVREPGEGEQQRIRQARTRPCESVRDGAAHTLGESTGCDQDEPGHQRRMSERDVQGDVPAHRDAEHDRAVDAERLGDPHDDVGQRAGAADRGDPARATETGQVECHDVVLAPEGLDRAEPGDPGTVGPAAVHEDEGRCRVGWPARQHADPALGKLDDALGRSRWDEMRHVDSSLGSGPTGTDDRAERSGDAGTKSAAVGGSRRSRPGERGAIQPYPPRLTSPI